MSGKTQRYQIEYPVPSDKVVDVAAIGQRAANRIDTLFDAAHARIQTGTLALNSMQPGEQTNTYSVTFNRQFSTMLVVIAQSENQRHNVAIWNVTATGFNWLVLNNTGGVSAAASVMWVAIGA